MFPPVVGVGVGDVGGGVGVDGLGVGLGEGADEVGGAGMGVDGVGVGMGEGEGGRSQGVASGWEAMISSMEASPPVARVSDGGLTLGGGGRIRTGSFGAVHVEGEEFSPGEWLWTDGREVCFGTPLEVV